MRNHDPTTASRYDVLNRATGDSCTVAAADDHDARIRAWTEWHGREPATDEERAELDTLDVREAGAEC